MAFKLPINLNAIAQGVGGIAFGGGEHSSEDDDSGVERLLDRISNGVLAEDRRAALAELQPIVAESASAQMAFGAMGFPVLLSVLREEREDIEMVRGSLETLVSALTPVDSTAKSSEVQPASMNSELLSREGESISLLLSLLSEDDFYIKYYTLQLLTALITNCCSRVQEAILATPRGITRLMDMLMDREVIRNEALLLLTYLTRDAEEIQKIVVFEGAFEKIFNIIKEEGGSEGGIVVQDCLELLNNLLRNNSTNQILLRETIGLQSVVSLLKLRKGSADGFSRQKTVNLLGVLETVALLLAGSSDTEHSKDTNRIANQSVFFQKKLLDCLIMLSVESRWAAVAIRSAAFRCIGDLIFRHSENRDALASKILGDGQDAEPALNSILRINLHTSSLQECWAAEHVFKCFCEGNPDGQMMLASTITPLPQSSFHGEHFTEDSHRLTFGSLLVRALVSNDSQNEPEAKGRAASILSHILKDNRQCKEWVLNIQLEIPVSSISSSELLMPRVVKHLAAVCPSSYSKGTSKQGPSEDNSMWLQVALLKLLVTWLADCPDAVSCFLQSPAHLAYIIDLLSGNCSSAKIPVTGLVVVLLGECIVFNKSTEDDKDAFMVVDAISQRIGLSTYFSIWDEMQRSPLFLSAFSASHQPRRFTRSSTSDTIVSEAYDYDSLPDNEDTGISHIDPSLGSFFDASVVHFIKELEPVVRSQIVELFSRPKSKVTIIPAELEQRDGESNDDYIMRLKSFVEKQCHEMQNLLGRNAALAEDMAKTRNDSAVEPDPSESGNNNRMQSVNGIKLRIESSTLRNELEEAQNKIEMLKAEKMKCESELSLFKQLAGKFEADLKSLSDAYNSLEQTNYRLELEIKSLRGEDSSIQSTLDAIKEEGRLEAQKESEAELNDLLVCLGQEQSKVEKLSARLTELGEDVETLLEGIGEEGEARDDNNEEEEQ
eukprot:TRINITY_DN8701_c0_g1_i1.p1 TRINITY_DN8701_c0_g1~~TRINITY_DN8701_c0_g1_i1.p1  ORF type:complete len:947 (-),score=232.58 TRINITY_DN8701_c0_g1_i1:187-3027(-)